MEELKKGLKPVKRKILIEKAVCWIMLLMSAGFLVCSVLILCGKFIFIEYLLLYILFILSGSLSLSLVFIIKTRPSDKETAQRVDLLGFKERFTTVFRWEGEKNTLWELVAADALYCVKNNDLAKMYRIKVNKKIGCLFILSAVFMLSSTFVPSPNKERFQNIRDMRVEEIDKIEAFEEKSKDILENLDEKNQILAEMILEQLKKEIKDSLSKEETQNALNTAAEELMKLSKNSVSNDFKSLDSMFKKSGINTQNSISDMVSKAYGDKVKDELKTVYDEIKNMPSEQLENLAVQIKNDIERLEESALSELLGELAAALESGDMESVEAQMAALGDYISEESELKAATEQLSDDFTDMFLLTSGDVDNNMSDDQGGLGSQTGAGLGNPSENQGGNGRGERHIENREDYSADSINKEFQIFSPKGNLNGEGTALTSEEKLLGFGGEYIDYDDVIGEYSQEALSSLDQENLPYGMKEIIKNYFSRIYE